MLQHPNFEVCPYSGPRLGARLKYPLFSAESLDQRGFASTSECAATQHRALGGRIKLGFRLFLPTCLKELHGFHGTDPSLSCHHGTRIAQRQEFQVRYVLCSRLHPAPLDWLEVGHAKQQKLRS